MIRKDREKPLEFALAIADKCTYAVLSTINEDNTPYAVPISIVREGMKIYFHCARIGKKIENLLARKAVCLTCVGDTSVPEDKFTIDYESAVICGSASPITEEAEKTRILRLICERHTPTNMAHFDESIARSLKGTAVWQITINQATGKSSY